MQNRDTKKARIAGRLESVAQLYVEGLPQTEIAQRLDVSLETVAEDLEHIQSAWLDFSLRDFDRARASELAHIDRLEAAAWKAWNRSREDEETTKVIKDGEKTRAERIIRKQAGDPKFLDRIAWCIDKRCRILGLEKLATPLGNDDDDAKLTPEHRKLRILEIVDTLRERRRAESAKDNAEPGTAQDSEYKDSAE